MLARRKMAAIDLYQTDLDRHAFAFEFRRRSDRPGALEVISAQLYHWWARHRARWKVVVANSTLFF